MMKHEGIVSHPPGGLVTKGPLINVVLAPDPHITEKLQDAGREVRQVQVKMMVDTGAEVTSVEDRFAQAIGLTPIRYRSIVGVSGKPELYPVYRMQISFGMGASDGKTVMASFAAAVVGTPPSPIPSENAGLLGRDFLQYFKFVYNGPDGRFEIIDERSPWAKAGGRAGISRRTWGTCSQARSWPSWIRAPSYRRVPAWSTPPGCGISSWD